MAVYEKTCRDYAMQIICDFYAQSEFGREIDTSYLYTQGLPASVDAEHLCAVLESMGYLTITRFYDHPSRVDLTDNGRCYFERKADKANADRVENIRYIITTAIAVSALITAIVSIILQYR